MEPVDLKSATDEMRKEGLRKWLLIKLTEAYEAARRGKLKTYDEHLFELNWQKNLVGLRDAILERRYEPGSSVSFVIFDPMVREIFAAPFRDRVVHHFLYNMQAGWWDRRFIYDSYSCRVGKGTLFGIRRAQKFMREATQNYQQKAYVVKLDIQGYFMSLKREKLYERVKWGLDRQFNDAMSDPMGYQLYDICKFLWRQVLLDDPVSKSWKRGPLSNWNSDVLPPRKSLYVQPYGQGIVIGNLTSQLVSNIFLDMLDRFIRFDLGYKWYGRYVDDFFIIVTEDDYEGLKKDVVLIENFLRDELGLKLHPDKRYYQEVSKGMSFLGARIYPFCLYPSNRLQVNFYKAIYEVQSGIKSADSIVSYLGIMFHMDADKLLERSFGVAGWDYRELQGGAEN